MKRVKVKKRRKVSQGNKGAEEEREKRVNGKKRREEEKER